jgi:hypothetical protein
MARIALGALTTLNTGTHLDPQFVDLYELRERFTTPSYTGTSATFRINSAGDLSCTGTVGIGSAASNGALGSTHWYTGNTNAMILYANTYFSGSRLFSTAGYAGAFEFDKTTGAWQIRSTAASGSADAAITLATRMVYLPTGHIESGVDNAQTFGTSSKRWSTIYAGTGTINTSDAREKTAVTPLTEAEVAAARDITREIGGFRFLAAMQEKGDAARTHIGLTVQRAIEIMESHGLMAERYAFICHDVWPERVVDHPAAMRPHPTLVDEDGRPVMVEEHPAYREIIPGGDRYGLRSDELLLFLARGMEARLTALEQAA